MAEQVDLYLDFDGVININGTRSSYLDASYGKAAGWKIEWRKGVIDYINSLPENVNLVWLTTWEMNNLAETELVPLLGITRPTVTISRALAGSSPYHEWWKARALNAWRELEGREDRKFIWIDDDLESSFHDIPEALLSEGLGLLMCPDWRSGITEEFMKEIDKFLEEVRV